MYPLRTQSVPKVTPEEATMYPQYLQRIPKLPQKVPIKNPHRSPEVTESQNFCAFTYMYSRVVIDLYP
jgi:hypothetical protein